jgi:DNA replication protein DnaC
MDNPMNAPETIELCKCRDCGADVVASTHEWNKGRCDPCHTMTKAKGDIGDGNMSNRMEKWADLCPEQYRTGPTDFIDEAKFKAITSWNFGPTGLVAVGHSRKGKTTSFWHLLHKLFVLQGHPFVAVSEPEFAILRERQNRYGALDQFLDKCVHTKIFFLDDIGHAATGSRHMEELYYIIEKRTSWRRPILATTQFSRAELQAKAMKSGTAKTSQAILNRLTSFCRFVTF